MLFRSCLYDEAKCRAAGIWETLKAAPIPIYMQRAYAEVLTSREYPLAQVRGAFTVRDRDKPFFVSTECYVLAFALLQAPAPRAIHLYGVDMTQDTEYELQRPSVEFLLGVAHGRGITVVVPSVSDLLKTAYLYGYEEGARETLITDLRERKLFYTVQREQLAAQMRRAQDAILQHDGVLADTEHHLRRVKL